MPSSHQKNIEATDHLGFHQPQQQQQLFAGSHTSASDGTFPAGNKRARDEPQPRPNAQKQKTFKTEEQNSTTATTSATSTNMNTSSTSTPTTAEQLTPEHIQGLRLEAIFHPKFDNEKQDQPSSKNRADEGFSSGTSSLVRTAMLQKLDKGYLEVSLKHSGSLILWSGAQRYYSKNSCHNQFTQVAEILLRQHFVRAWWKGDAEADKEQALTETKYHECSRYIEEHRLTLAFEVVTAILGDHGDIPKKDFMILTAVADRKRERFYSTSQVLEFCQKFRLPHNDVWTYTNPQSAQRLFQLYDECRETDLAVDTVQGLSQTADAFVPSMYPHIDFQGNILEGFIIRYVAYDDESGDNVSSSSSNASMLQLASGAQDILNHVPSDRPPCFDLLPSDVADLSPALSTDLRALHQSIPFDYELASSRSPGAAAGKQGQQFQQKLSKILGQLETEESDDADRDTSNNDRHDLTKISGGKVHLPSLVRHLLDDSSIDKETRRIAQLLQTLDDIKGVVNYSLFTMPAQGNSSENTSRLFCIIHVMQDATFFKFQRQQLEDGMSLFRGFFIELLPERVPESVATDTAAVQQPTTVSITSQPSLEADTDDDKFLMLKMKLLPYMVRTFICRNLLRVLEKDGPEKFYASAESLLEKWGISEQATKKWMPFFNAWGQYVVENRSLDGPKVVKGASGKEVDLGPLTNFSYLRHLEHFTRLYESGQIKVKLSPDRADPDTFQGLLCVVSENIDISKAIANFLAEMLGSGGSEGSVSVLSLQQAIKSKITRSVIVYTALGEKAKGMKAFLSSPSVLKHLFLVFVGSEQDSLLNRFGGGSDTSHWFPTLTQGDLKRLENVWNKVWKKQPCKQTYLLPCSAVSLQSKDGTVEVDSTSDINMIDFAKYMQKNMTEAASAEEARLTDPTQRGVLVVFPCIPGSGKSSVLENMESKLQEQVSSHADRIGSDRKVFVKEGDKIGKPFWNLAGNLLAGDGDPRPSLFIADKNVPPPSWPKVGQICDDTKALPVLVLPDSQILQTTTIEGAVTPEGAHQPYHSHFYPFSLKYLAMCLERVMARPAGNHAGKLDSGMPIACMIVVQFFSFYRSNSADTLADNIVSKLEDSGASSADLLKPIQVPFLSPEGCSEQIPEDLQKLLVESLQVRYGNDIGKKTSLSSSDEQLLDLEARLRASLVIHQSLIRGWSVSLEDSQATFTQELLNRLESLKHCDSLKTDVSPEQKKLSECSKKLKLVSIDTKRSDVHDVLKQLEKSGKIDQFLEIARSSQGLQGQAALDEEKSSSVLDQNDAFPSPGFIEDAHVTMAFAGRKSSARTLIRRFQRLQGHKIKLTVTGFLWSSTHAAFSVDIANKTSSENGTSNEMDIPECENIFPHITIWCAAGAKAFHSNNLPRLVDAGEASKVPISAGVELQGELTFWDHGNTPFQF